jgi:iron complex transport system ATP-binding protein
MNTTTPALLSAQALCMQADGVTVLDNITMELQRGELLGVIGPNGAGKSTLLKVLAGIDVATAGSVLLEGTPLQQLSATQRARRIAWLEQRPLLHWPLTVRQVVALGRLPYRGNNAAVVDAAAIDKALAMTGIEGLQQRLFPRLSEGEKLLVNLARILATQCDVILADEPTSALDPRHQLQVMALLQQLALNGAGVVVVLHDLTLAARYCHRLLLLHAGKVAACGTPAALLTVENLAQVYGIAASFDTDSSTVLIKGPLP